MDTSKFSPEQGRAYERIRKLLERVRLAQGTEGSEAETNNAMEMAAKLMRQHSLAEEMFMATDAPDKGMMQTAFESVTRLYAFSRVSFKGVEWFYDLAWAVQEVTDSKWCTQRRLEKNPQARGGQTHSYRDCIDFYGLPLDVHTARDMMIELIATTHAMARMRFGRGWTLQHNSYAMGFAQRLWSRSRHIKVHGADPALGAIVINKKALLRRYEVEVLKWPSDEELAAARAKVEANGGVLSDSGHKPKKQRSRKVDFSAMNAGHTDANDVDFANGRLEQK